MTTLTAQDRLVVWAGRVMMAEGIVHLAVTFSLAAKHVPSWSAGDLWSPAGGLANLSPSGGAFWLSVGGFGLPLAVLGGVVAAMGKARLSPPGFVGWGIGAWGLACAAIFEPTPFAATLIPAAMLIAARRNRRNAARNPT